MEENRTSPKLLLKIVSPSGLLDEIECDSIVLSMAEGDRMKGGSIGIRHGHENSIIALQKGLCEGRMSGETVFSKELEGGFAIVKDNVVSVMTGT